MALIARLWLQVAGSMEKPSIISKDQVAFDSPSAIGLKRLQHKVREKDRPMAIL